MTSGNQSLSIPARQRGAAVLLVFFLAAVAGGCQRDDDRGPCIQPRTVYMRLGSYTLRDTVYVDSALPAALLVPVGSTVALQAPGATADFSVSLSPLADSCTYLIIPDTAAPGVHDTVTFLYTRTLAFLSNACSYTHFFTLTGIRYTRTALDSAAVTDPAVTNDADPEHIRLFY